MVAIIVLAVAVYVQRMTQGDPTARRRCWHKEGSRGDFDEEEDVVEEEKKMKMVVVVMMVRRRRRKRRRRRTRARTRRVISTADSIGLNVGGRIELLH